ncbi:hypothetical protein CPT_Momento_056 [Burkholderia phage Momento]|uniref:Uncharacterized protein n=1 Tax=Burkholderia phage Momento TaxID=2924902 RepID=A0AAE9G8S4_9CAUD|nr:hypothetical protein CPT_Momento_056 [Burkholderia phage Momento]
MAPCMNRRSQRTAYDGRTVARFRIVTHQNARFPGTTNRPKPHAPRAAEPVDPVH